MEEDQSRMADSRMQSLLQKEKAFSEAQELLFNKDNLCFNIDRFVGAEFLVDQFVSECKDRVSLQTLREDLETHYKNIRVALIDLINKDYADFVSLSSNLVGMEKSIEHLRQPLGQLREEIRVSRKGLNDELKLIESKLNHRKEVRGKKTKLQHLLNVVNSVEKIEKILFGKPGSAEINIYSQDSSESMGHFLERVAGEFNQLQFHVNQSKGHPIIDKIKSRVSLITSKLQESLETSFLEGLSSNQSDLVLRCLRTYALIDKTGHAEDLFRHNFVKPRMEKLITEDAYNSKGLENICADIIRFISTDCQMLIKLTTEKRQTSGKDEKEDFVKGFDFLVNTVWPEVDDGFETKLSFIFSPGNPDLFFQRYKIVMEFVDEFEECCTSFYSFQRLRAHSSYQTFMTKWSLPVYFQIRFQEIGGMVEAAIETTLKTAVEDSELFSTNLVATVWKALNRCWDDKVFLQPLFSRFWKLFLQILSRLKVALKSISDEVGSSKDQHAESEEKPVHDAKASSEYCLVDLGRLYGDIYKLKSKVAELFKTKVEPLLKATSDAPFDQHEEAFKEGMDGFKFHLDVLANYFIKSLSDEGSLQLENTKNIPRLYRRTNRDPPTQASAYVTLAFAPIKGFSEDISDSLDKEQLQDVLQEAVFVMTSRYYIIVDELVASIKKTEESLQRLKRLRKGADATTATSSSSDVSDETKIRKQLLLDVQQFGKEASSITSFQMENHAEYKKLLELVVNVSKTNQ